MRKAIAILLALLPIPAAAQAPEGGGALAQRWCMACHVIEREPPSAAAIGIPSFPAIAAKPGTTAESLDAFLSSGHTRMPDFSLSRNERRALITYILSLR